MTDSINIFRLLPFTLSDSKRIGKLFINGAKHFLYDLSCEKNINSYSKIYRQENIRTLVVITGLANGIFLYLTNKTYHYFENKQANSSSDPANNTKDNRQFSFKNLANVGIVGGLAFAYNKVFFRKLTAYNLENIDFLMISVAMTIIYFSKTKISNRFKNSNQEISGLKSQLNAANQQLQSLQSEFDTANQQLQSLQSEFDTANQSLQSLQSQLDAANQQSQSLQSELDAANQSLQSLQSQLDAANQQSQSLQSELDAANQSLQSLQPELNAANQQSQSLQSELDAANQQSQSLQSHFDIASQSLQRIQSELHTVNQSSQSLQSDLDTIKQTLQNKEAVLLGVENVNGQLTDAIVNASRRYSQLIEKNELLNSLQPLNLDQELDVESVPLNDKIAVIQAEIHMTLQLLQIELNQLKKLKLEISQYSDEKSESDNEYIGISNMFEIEPDSSLSFTTTTQDNKFIVKEITIGQTAPDLCKPLIVSIKQP